jgi:hypothetical protein
VFVVCGMKPGRVEDDEAQVIDACAECFGVASSGGISALSGKVGGDSQFASEALPGTGDSAVARREFAGKGQRSILAGSICRKAASPSGAAFFAVREWRWWRRRG